MMVQFKILRKKKKLFLGIVKEQFHSLSYRTVIIKKKIKKIG
jgi:hypothetical protein